MWQGINIPGDRVVVLFQEFKSPQTELRGNHIILAAVADKEFQRPIGW